MICLESRFYLQVDVLAGYCKPYKLEKIARNSRTVVCHFAQLRATELQWKFY